MTVKCCLSPIQDSNCSVTGACSLGVECTWVSMHPCVCICLSNNSICSLGCPKRGGKGRFKQPALGPDWFATQAPEPHCSYLKALLCGIVSCECLLSWEEEFLPGLKPSPWVWLLLRQCCFFKSCTHIGSGFHYVIIH